MGKITIQNQTQPQTNETQTDSQDMLTKIKKVFVSKSINVYDHASNLRTYVSDRIGNQLSAIGNDDEVSTRDYYDMTNDTMNYWLWMSLYNDNWVFKRAIDKPGEDIISKGITIIGKDDYSNVYKRLNRLKPKLIQLVQLGRLFGGSVAVMLFDNLTMEDYKKPIDENKIKEAKTIKLYVVDRWYGVSQEGTENVDDLTDDDYGKPKFYRIIFENGDSAVIHYSYILRYEHTTPPPLIKKTLSGWGYAEGAHIFAELSRNSELKASIQSLVNKSLIEVIQMEGMRGVFMGSTESKNQEQLQARLEMVNWARTYNSLTLLDKSDVYHMNSFNGLGGLDNLLNSNMKEIAAAVNMPMILFGDIATGFSGDSKALFRYDDFLDEQFDALVRTDIEKLVIVLCKMEKKTITYDTLYRNSIIKEERDAQFIQILSSIIGIEDKLLNQGIVNAEQYGNTILDYTTNKSINLHIDKDSIEKLKEDWGNQFENTLNEINNVEKKQRKTNLKKGGK